MAEADNVIVTSKVTYQSVFETKAKKMKRDQKKTKRAAAAKQNVRM